MKKKWKTKTKTWKKKKIKNKSKERKQENRINFHKKLCFMNFEFNNYCGDIYTLTYVYAFPNIMFNSTKWEIND